MASNRQTRQARRPSATPPAALHCRAGSHARRRAHINAPPSAARTRAGARGARALRSPALSPGVPPAPRLTFSLPPTPAGGESATQEFNEGLHVEGRGGGGGADWRFKRRTSPADFGASADAEAPAAAQGAGAPAPAARPSGRAVEWREHHSRIYRPPSHPFPPKPRPRQCRNALTGAPLNWRRRHQ